MRAMMQILLVKTSSMGDVIHNLPVVADILARHENAKIDWMVEESFAEIPKLHPNVRNVIPVAVRRWRKSPLSSSTWREINALKHQLGSIKYDAIIDTQGLLKSALLTKLAQGQSHGMDFHSAREPLASLFYHHRHRVEVNQHAVIRNRQLPALALHYPVPATAPDYGLSAIENPIPGEVIDKTGTAYVVCLHGTSSDAKLWPTEQWIALAHKLAKVNLTMLLPWSNPAEQARAAMIATQAPNATVLPKLKLTDLAGILAGATANIGVDTGLIHLSTALNKPTVAIYTDTKPNLTGVFPSISELAVNIGNKGQIPSADSVFEHVLTLIKQVK